MTNKTLAIVIAVFSVVLLPTVAYFAYDVYRIERRIDAMVRTHLERVEGKR
jgi:hypothetical protein